MANYQRYQPRRRNTSSGGWGRWAVGLVVIVSVFLLGKSLLGGKKDTANKNSNSDITLVTDNANRALSSTPTNTSLSLASASGADWQGFTVKQCPTAISSFGTKKRAVVTIALSAANDQITPVLEALKTAKMPADFFSTGSFAAKNPNLLKQVADAGYHVYSQSYDGTNLTSLSDEEVVSAIDKTETAIFNATGVSPKPVFRPPGGSYTDQTIKLINQQGYCAILWTVDAYDWQDGMTAAQSKDRVMAALDKHSGGSIIALHAGYDVTAELVKVLAAELKTQKIELTTLAGLLTA